MKYTSKERERLEELFRANHGSVHAYVSRRVAGSQVDDIVSEVFLVAWRRIDDVPGASESLPWLLGVARNTLATAKRGDARRSRLHQRAQVEDAQFDEPAERDREGGLVRAALARLSSSDQEAITLVAWEGLTPTQAAAALGIPANRFRVRLHRAGRRLRWALQAEADGAAGPERHEFASTPQSHGVLS
jgi:RNA polymerase sigma factor (sigma-70 family)